MTVGSLFAGIGGFDLAATRCGMEVRWQVEIDPWCRRVLAKHWPEVPRFGDIRDLTGDELEPVDLFAAGVPCQGVSKAAMDRAQGLDDPRSGLWSHVARLVGRLRPRFLVVENSPALTGRGLARILADLTALRYDAEWSVIPACAFGAPHLRERLWLVAYPDGDRLEGLDREGLTAGHPGGSRDVAPASLGEMRATDWLPEPGVCRVGDGFPARVDRLTGLGNAVVPAAAEWLLRQVLAVAIGERVTVRLEDGRRVERVRGSVRREVSP